jgi:hypothetical protein
VAAMTLKYGKHQEGHELRPYVIIAEETTLSDPVLESTAIGSGLYDKEAHKKEYEQQLQQMKAFHERLKHWISIKGIAEQVKSLEDPKTPVGFLIALCTPASAVTIEQMPGVKAVIQEP